MSKMVFIGSVYPTGLIQKLLNRKEHIDFAANTFQRSLLEGLCNCYNDITVITSPVTTHYPKSNTKAYSRTVFKEVIGRELRLVFPGFWNFPLIKMFTEFFNVKRVLNYELLDKTDVFVYALHTPFLYATYKLRKRIPHICVIVPDIPEYMSSNKGLLRWMMKRLNRVILDKCLKVCDSFVLLSPYMKDHLPIGDKPWVQVEGIYVDLSSYESPTKYREKTLLYSGIISSKYGVFDLIEAFMQIDDPDFKLLLCGSCQSELTSLKELIGRDSRIQYLGMLTMDEVRKLQREVTLLVNPRHSHEEFTKYSFPSKTMEYLASGTPTLMCHLPAIPKEYDNHLFYFNDESIKGMRDKIIEICSMSSNVLREHGMRARQFIVEEKNAYKQAQKVFDMIYHQ